MIADEFAVNKEDEADESEEEEDDDEDSADESWKEDIHFLILQGMIKQEPTSSIDVLVESRFHYRNLKNPEDDILAFESENLEESNYGLIDAQKYESHIDIQ